MSSRFDYVKYDKDSQDTQARIKSLVIELEHWISALPSGRPQALALTSLEECYMWIGKAIRDEQIARVGSAELQEGRKDG